MFLHIGNSRVVSLGDLIGIFNMEIKNNQVNTQFLEVMCAMMMILVKRGANGELFCNY